ncbi:hypothetical protein ACIRSS_29575 [Amycolatopsis sp. NPDC101161]|uniref:hypothetical protein n=1 Tax=Amycolatopsis sp. NPDC101161 TaxID=3363940 RepID=UPI0037F49855
MDEDYARKLRAWLSAEPEATPRRAEEEREWLREVPAPQADPDRWTVRGRLPQEEELEEEWVCPVIALPVPRASEENGCRMSSPDDRRSRNRTPRGKAAGELRFRNGRVPGEAAPGQAGVSEAGARLPGEAAADQPGASEIGEWRSRNQRLPGEAAPGQPGMSEAEARSRWNHPSNWHRRRRAEGQHGPDQPGSH